MVQMATIDLMTSLFTHHCWNFKSG